MNQHPDPCKSCRDLLMHAMYRQIIIRYRVKSDGRMVFLEIDSSMLSRFAFWLPEIPPAHF